MKQKLIILLLSLAISPAISQKEISINDVFLNRTFTQDWVYGLNSMNDGIHYTTLEYGDTTAIEKYSYQSGEKVDIILKSIDIELDFTGYTFNENESLVLLETNSEKLYRHSKKSIYYLYDLNTKKVTKISEKKIRLPEFSPNSKYISYIYKNNIYTYDINSEETTKITHKGLPNKIICGATDWVYEEEFGFTKAYAWSPNSESIAYYIFDESKVPEFSMDVFEEGLYPKQERFKYPKAGERNSKVRINIFNIKSGKNIEAKINKKKEFYFPRMKWTNKSNRLFVQRMNRHQNHLEMLSVNPSNGDASLVFEEKENTYIDVHDNLIFYNDDSFFLWTSEKDGYNHIYLYRIDGKKIRQITKGDWEVTQFYGYDQINKTLYYQSTEKSSLQRDIYSINVFGKKKKLLSKERGSNNAKFSKNYKYFINTYSSANSPNIIDLYDSRGKKQRNIKNSNKLTQTLTEYNLTKKEFFEFTTEDGVNLNGWMMKPIDFDSNKKYPVLMYVYGGPGSQTVTDSWGGQYMWYQMLCQQGYIVVSIDNRGTGGRGSEFKKCTYKELGKLETIDQIEGAKYLSSLSYVDKQRIGIWGWSYGGYMSSLCILKGSQYFNTAIAVAPVTNWRFYDTIYTERYMQTPQENSDGYDLNSPIHYADSLSGNYLLIHGSADDNVHVQNTYEMVNALVKANKQFELFIYPDKNHSIYGGNTRLHLFTQITDFITKNL